MTLDEIKQLIEFIKGHELHEFELEQDGVKIRIKSGGNHHHVAATAAMPAAPPIATRLRPPRWPPLLAPMGRRPLGLSPRRGARSAS